MTRNIRTWMPLIAAAATALATANALGATVVPYFKENGSGGALPAQVVDFLPLGGPAASPGVAFTGNAASGGWTGLYALPPGATAPIPLPAVSGSVIGVGAIAGITGGAVAGRVVARMYDAAPGGTSGGLYAFAPGGGPAIRLGETNLADPSYGPAMSLKRDKIVHRDLAARVGGGTAPVIVVRDAADPTRLAQSIDVSGFESVGRPAVDSAGDVAFVGTPLGAVRANVYFHRAGTGAQFQSVIDDADHEAIAGDQVALADAAPGHARVYFSRRTTNQTLIAQESRSFYQSDIDAAAGTIASPELLLAGTDAEPLGDAFSVSVESTPTGLIATWAARRGYQYWKAHSDMGAARLTNNPASPLIGPGDAVDGSTVVSVRMDEGSLLAGDAAMAYLTLANGDHGFYLVSVPEPTTLLTTLAYTSVMRRRRRGM